jgi:hypothetical protein
VELLKAGTTLDDATPENVVATTSADDAGEYRFGFMLPGSYALRATRPAGDVGCAEKALVDNVAVTDGTSTSASIELPATP